MANLQAIRGQLSSIQVSLLKLPVFVSGRPDSDTKADALAARLEAILQQVSLILRELKSTHHLAQLRATGARKLPHDQRWSAKQSADSTISEVAALATIAQNLEKLIRDLLEKNGILTPIQASKKAMDLIKDFEKYFSSHTQTGTLNPSELSIHMPTPPAPGSMAFESMVPVVTFVYLALRYWRDRLKANHKS